MEMQLRTKNYRMTPNLRAYVEKKVPRLTRYLDDIAETRVEFSQSTTRSRGPQIIAQLTVTLTNGVILRAEERSGDPYTSLDAVLDTMERQVARFKERYYQGRIHRRVGQPLSLSERGGCRGGSGAGGRRGGGRGGTPYRQGQANPDQADVQR